MKRYTYLLIMSLICVTLSAQIQIANYSFGNAAGTVSNNNVQLMVTMGQTITGQIQDSSFSMTLGFWSFVNAMTTYIEFYDLDIPTEFRLGQNYPNPFNPNTIIDVKLPESCHVTIQIYNMLGQKICTLIDAEKQAGLYHLKWVAGNQVAGIYFYQMTVRKETAVQYQSVRKMMLVK